MRQAEKKSSELFEEMEVLRAESTELGHKIKEATEKSAEAWEHAASFERIVAKLEGKRIEADAKEESVRELRSDLKEMSDSDEELRSILGRYEERVALYEDEMKTQRERYGELSRELEKTRKSIGVKQSEVGKYQAQKDQYERQLQHREALVKETARRHQIRGFDLEVTDEHVRDFMERIGKMARDYQATLERARRETQESLQTVQKTLNQLNEKKSALNQSKDSSRSQIAVNDRNITGIQAQLNGINIDEGGKAVLESNIEEVERQLLTAKSEFDGAAWDTKIRETESELRALDDRKDALDAELIQGTKEAGDSARLDFLRKESKDRQRSYDTMKGAHGARIAEVVGHQWGPETLEREFQRVLDTKSAEWKDAELQRDGTQRELEQLEFKLNTLRNDLRKSRKQAKDSEERIREAIEDEPSTFPSALQTLQANRDILKQDQSSFKNLEKYYGECVEAANAHNVCRLCRRGLSTKDKTDLVTRLQTLITQAAQNAINSELELYEEDLQKAKAVSGDYDTWQRLTENDVPRLESETSQLEARRETLLTKIEEQDQVVSEHKETKRDVESLTKTVHNLVKYYSDIASFESQIQELAAKQSQTGRSRGLELIQEDLKKVSEQSRSVKTALLQMTTEKDRARNQINSLELEARDVKAKLSAAVYQLKEKASLMAQVEELKSRNSEHREAIRRADQELQALLPEISQTQAKYDDISSRGDVREKELQQEASRMSDSRHQLQLADQEINAYVDKGGPQQLTRSRREIEHLEAELSRLETSQREITLEVKQLEDQLRNHSETKRVISDNLKYRRDYRALQTVRAEIAELEAHNAEADKERYDREASKWQMQRNKLTAEQASMIGSLKSKDDQLTQLLQDWETDYKDAAFKYKEAHIKVETTKAAIEDLGRYGGALDKAIMKYHSLKMEEINRIIEELWKRTYQGTDVDTILIRSDNEGVKGNKSYNYRVCMVKQDAEMDMRGRCSAGQKVLASIIIRLALAECFGVNCGLIALDEPTTNLDRDNIRALAEALAEIIRVRRQQSNFQLIVITHDEDFLRYMQCADFCDNYYRVSRSDRQKSIIERQSIAEVSLLVLLNVLISFGDVVALAVLTPMMIGRITILTHREYSHSILVLLTCLCFVWLPGKCFMLFRFDAISNVRLSTKRLGHGYQPGHPWAWGHETSKR